MECFGTTDFDNNSRLITLSAIIISGLHCITRSLPYRKSAIRSVFYVFPALLQNYCSWALSFLLPKPCHESVQACHLSISVRVIHESAYYMMNKSCVRIEVFWDVVLCVQEPVARWQCHIQENVNPQQHYWENLISWKKFVIYSWKHVMYGINLMWFWPCIVVNMWK